MGSTYTHSYQKKRVPDVFLRFFDQICLRDQSSVSASSIELSEVNSHGLSILLHLLPTMGSATSCASLWLAL